MLMRVAPIAAFAVAAIGVFAVIAEARSLSSASEFAFERALTTDLPNVPLRDAPAMKDPMLPWQQMVLAHQQAGG
jgi:hypothetical protein